MRVSFCNQAYNCVSSCFRRIQYACSSNARSTNEAKVPLIGTAVESLPSEETLSFSSRLSFSEKVLGSVFCLSLASVSAFLASTIKKIASSCFEAEVASQEEFNECIKPYVPTLIFFHSVLAVSSLGIGVLTNKALKKPFSPQQRGSSTLNLTRTVFQTTKEKHHYEVMMFLIYLYNGIGINVSNSSSFASFLNCIAAGTSLIPFYLGVFSHERLSKPLPELEKKPMQYPVKVLIIPVTLGAFGIAFSFIPNISTKAATVIRELGTIFIFYPTGFLAKRNLEKKESSFSNSTALKCFQRIHQLKIPFLVTGYTLYLLPQRALAFLGLSLLGFNAGFESSKTREIVIYDTFFRRPLAKEIFPLLTALGFIISLQVSPFLDCQGHPSRYNYSCPIGLELSGYTNPNQLVIESQGASVLIGAAISQYYLLRMVECFLERIPQGRHYLRFSDTMQPHLLSFSPYALLQANQLSSSSFYTYNPFLFLTMVGFTLGTNKDRIHNQEKYKIEPVKGEAVSNLADQIADLRISIFSEYPYLYQGNLEEEKRYFQMYMGKSSSLCVILKDSDSVVGMALGVSLEENSDESYKVPFQGENISEIFYLGDLILKEEYRKKGLGKKLYLAFEEAVKKQDKYRSIIFCEITRSESDPRRPQNHRDLNTFWESFGYVKDETKKIQSEWTEIGQDSPSSHDLVFSIKTLNQDT